VKARLAWESRGEGDKTIIVLPWFGVDRSFAAAAFEPAVDKARLRRVYVDLPGCGDSPPGPPSSDGIIDEILRLIGEQFSAERVLLAGFSYGGYLATGLARRRPEAFDGLFLACTTFRIRPEHRELPPAPTAPPHWLPSISAEFRDHLAAALGTPSEATAREIDARLRNLPPADDSYLAQLREHGYPLSDEDTPFVYDRPVALVLGRQDRIAGYASQFRALDAYPTATFTLLDHAGHYLPFERPDPFNASVHEWLARIPIQQQAPQHR
jgi:pimeloyl-ACP methyl ester carboxylesterase